MFGALLFVLNTIAPLTAGSQARATGAPRDWTTFNVCQLVPGDAVAKAVAAKLNEARPFYDKTFSRCTYLVTLTTTNKPTGYVVWMEPEANFEELKRKRSRRSRRWLVSATRRTCSRTRGTAVSSCGC